MSSAARLSPFRGETISSFVTDRDRAVTGECQQLSMWATVAWEVSDERVFLISSPAGRLGKPAAIAASVFVAVTGEPALKTKVIFGHVLLKSVGAAATGRLRKSEPWYGANCRLTPPQSGRLLIRPAITLPTAGFRTTASSPANAALTYVRRDRRFQRRNKKARPPSMRATRVAYRSGTDIEVLDPIGPEDHPLRAAFSLRDRRRDQRGSMPRLQMRSALTGAGGC